jgi:hypothetical protein
MTPREREGLDDLPAYRYMFSRIRYEPDFAMAERRRGQVAEMGLVMCFLPWSPLMRMVVVDAGIECVVMMHADAPEEFEETLRVVREYHERSEEVLLRAMDAPQSTAGVMVAAGVGEG